MVDILYETAIKKQEEVIMDEKVEEFVSQEDMGIINKAKVEVQNALQAAEKQTAIAKIADLEYRNIIQQVFIKYGLKLTDQINEQGLILRVSVPVIPVEELLAGEKIA